MSLWCEIKLLFQGNVIGQGTNPQLCNDEEGLKKELSRTGVR